jgi:hypothetical protein
VTFRRNVGFYGAAVGAQVVAALTVQDCVFEGNNATLGGAMYLEVRACVARVSVCARLLGLCVRPPPPRYSAAAFIARFASAARCCVCLVAEH